VSFGEMLGLLWVQRKGKALFLKIAMEDMKSASSVYMYIYFLQRAPKESFWILNMDVGGHHI